MMDGYNARRRIQLEDLAWTVGHIIGVHPSRLLSREQTEEEAMAVVRAFSAMQG